MGVKKSFEAIERLSTRGYLVKLLCTIAHVSRSGYYRYVQATQKPNRDVLLAEKVRQVQEEVRYRYGAKRMAQALSKQVQEPVNHKRIARIMQEYLVGARIRLRRHPEYWYRQRHTVRLSDRQCAPNIPNRDFLSSCPLNNRGPAYRSEEYQALLRNHGIVASYSRAGNCWDNALMECFFGHMKCELGLVTGSQRK